MSEELPDQLKSLVSLALLQVNLEEGKDYYTYLVPQVEYVIGFGNLENFVSSDVSIGLLQHFGLKIPDHAVELVLKRLARSKRLTKKDKRYYKSAIFDVDGLDQKRSIEQLNQKVVISSLMAFAEQRFSLKLSEYQAADVLISYIARFGIACLKAFHEKSVLPRVTAKQAELFVVAEFVIHAYEQSDDLFSKILNLVKGHMLSNALLCEDLETLDRKFERTTFYIDTPFLLHLFGFYGPAIETSAKELIDLIHRLKGTTAIYRHTRREIDYVLGHCETNLNKVDNKSHKTLLEMRKHGISISDVSVLRARLDEHLRKNLIHLKDTPPYEGKYQIDEKRLKQILESEIQYSNEQAKEIDINSVRSIFAERKGEYSRILEDVKAVLVTTNEGLASAAQTYAETVEQTDVPPVITDFSLTNLAWLKSPLASPEIPRIELMAECAALISPSDRLWRKYLNQIDKLKENGNIQARDHDILRSSIRARDELMELTLGEVSNVTVENIHIILGTAKESMIAEKQCEINSLKESGEIKENLLRKKESRLDKISGKVTRISAVMATIVAALIVTTFAALIILGSLCVAFADSTFSKSIGGISLIVFVVGCCVIHQFIAPFTLQDVFKKMKRAIFIRIRFYFLKLLAFDLE